MSLSAAQARRLQGADEQASERTPVRERVRGGGNAAGGRITGGQSRRRMTPISFPWIRTDG